MELATRIRQSDVLDRLAEEGWLILPDALPPESIRELRRVLLERLNSGRFQAARVGQGDAATRQDTIRSDAIDWIRDDEQEPALQAWLQHCRDLCLAFNEAFYLSLNSLDCHFACYEAGAFYQKHRDSFRADAARRISLVLFLNDDWQEEDEGELVIYAAGEPDKLAARVLPKAGTLAIFQSEKIFHEVKAPRRQRLSLTGWLKTSQDIAGGFAGN